MLSISLRQLEYALAVAQHGSVSLAANAIHVSQPALSVAINNLEAHLGQRLFIRRKGSPLKLTTFGRDFIAQAQCLIDDADKLTSPQPAGEPAQSIIIGCFEDLAPLFVGRLLRSLEQAFPRLQVELRLGSFESLSMDLEAGNLDLVISYNLGLESHFHSQTLCFIQPHVLLYPNHPLCQFETLSIEQLEHQGLILVNQNHSIWHMVKLFRQQGFEPTIKHRVANYEVMRSLVANGLGLGLSYTLAQTQTCYDGQPLVTRPISNLRQQNLAEPVVLASNPHNPVEHLSRQIGDLVQDILTSAS